MLVPDDPSFDYKLWSARKDKQSFDFLVNPKTGGLVLSPAVACTEATDSLSKRVQHLDAVGYSIRELVDDRGPVTLCQARLYCILHPKSTQDGERGMNTFLPTLGLPIQSAIISNWIGWATRRG